MSWTMMKKYVYEGWMMRDDGADEDEHNSDSGGNDAINYSIIVFKFSSVDLRLE